MFQGNSIYMKDGQAVIPPGAVADRLAQGNFGPMPNQTAPPGFRIPRTLSPEELAKALSGQTAQPPSPAPSMQGVAGVPEGFMFNPETGTFGPPMFGAPGFSPDALMKFHQSPGGQRYMQNQFLNDLLRRQQQGYGFGGAMGMDVGGQGAFGDMGYSGVGYGDSY